MGGKVSTALTAEEWRKSNIAVGYDYRQFFRVLVARKASALAPPFYSHFCAESALNPADTGLLNALFADVSAAEMHDCVVDDSSGGALQCYALDGLFLKHALSADASERSEARVLLLSALNESMYGARVGDEWPKVPVADGLKDAAATGARLQFDDECAPVSYRCPLRYAWQLPTHHLVGAMDAALLSDFCEATHGLFKAEMADCHSHSGELYRDFLYVVAFVQSLSHWRKRNVGSEKYAAATMRTAERLRVYARNGCSEVLPFLALFKVESDVDIVKSEPLAVRPVLSTDSQFDFKFAEEHITKTLARKQVIDAKAAQMLARAKKAKKGGRINEAKVFVSQYLMFKSASKRYMNVFSSLSTIVSVVSDSKFHAETVQVYKKLSDNLTEVNKKKSADKTTTTDASEELDPKLNTLKKQRR